MTLLSIDGLGIQLDERSVHFIKKRDNPWVGCFGISAAKEGWLRIYILDRQHRLRLTYDHDRLAQSEPILEDIRYLLDESS